MNDINKLQASLDMMNTMLRFSLFFSLFVFTMLHMFVLYLFYKRMDFEKPWLAFVPIFPVCLFPFFWKIGHRWTRSLLWFIPIANIYFCINDFIQFYKVIHVRVKLCVSITFLVPLGFYFILMVLIIKGESNNNTFSKTTKENNYHPVDFPQELKRTTRERPTRGKERSLAYYFYDDDSNSLFVNKWLKSNLEVYIQNGFNVRKTFFYELKSEFEKHQFTNEDIKQFVKEKHLYYDDCLSLFNHGARDSSMAFILEHYMTIFNALCDLTFGSKEPNRLIITIVESIIHLIKAEDAKEAAFYYELLFSADTIYLLANELGIDQRQLEIILKDFYHQ